MSNTSLNYSRILASLVLMSTPTFLSAAGVAKQHAVTQSTIFYNNTNGDVTMGSAQGADGTLLAPSIHATHNGRAYTLRSGQHYVLQLNEGKQNETVKLTGLGTGNITIINGYSDWNSFILKAPNSVGEIVIPPLEEKRINIPTKPREPWEIQVRVVATPKDTSKKPPVYDPRRFRVPGDPMANQL